MIKTVNISTRIPIRNVKPPLQGNYKNIKMDTSDIVKCLNRRARVEEVLSDGTTVQLTLSNYYKDHSNLVNMVKKETQSQHQATIDKMENKEEPSNTVTEDQLNSADVIVMEEQKEEVENKFETEESVNEDTVLEEENLETDEINKDEVTDMEKEDINDETKQQAPVTSNKNNKANIKNKK